MPLKLEKIIKPTIQINGVHANLEHLLTGNWIAHCAEGKFSSPHIHTSLQKCHAAHGVDSVERKYKNVHHNKTKLKLRT